MKINSSHCFFSLFFLDSPSLVNRPLFQSFSFLSWLTLYHQWSEFHGIIIIGSCIFLFQPMFDVCYCIDVKLGWVPNSNKPRETYYVHMWFNSSLWFHNGSLKCQHCKISYGCHISQIVTVHWNDISFQYRLNQLTLHYFAYLKTMIGWNIKAFFQVLQHSGQAYCVFKWQYTHYYKDFASPRGGLYCPTTTKKSNWQSSIVPFPPTTFT